MSLRMPLTGSKTQRNLIRMRLFGERETQISFVSGDGVGKAIKLGSNANLHLKSKFKFSNDK
ncbi:hypothetical protein BLOT_008874 [Blomia tropicalis]|nr:hypothetical protein BLOT_008874 [Blomia tropicalis]